MVKKRKSNSRNSSKVRQFILLIFVLSILGGGYYYLKKMTHEEIPPNPTLDETAKYSVLENTDSVKYLAIIIYQSNISINDISSTFYKDEIFWPYIYLENKESIYNPLNISRDIVLRIPRLPEKTIDLKDTTSVRITKILADSILNEVKSPI